MNIKVALVTYGMLGGGIETYIINLGHFLSSRGMDVTVVATEVPGAWFERVKEHGIKIKYIDGLDALLPTEHVLKINDVLRQDGYNVIFLNHSRYAQAAIDLLDDDTIVFPVLHGNDDVFQSMSFYNSDICNGLVAVSPRLENSLKGKKIECPIITIPNGVGIIDITNYKQRTFYENQLRLIYVGRLYHKEKGIFFIPDILRKIEEADIDVCVDIVGDGNDRNELIGMFEDRNLSGKVRMWGTLESLKVYELLCQAHFLLFPSFTEGLPCVPIEAQMCGCIPIASRLKGSTDVIIDGKKTGVLVEVGDIDGIYQSIVNLWLRRDHIVQMSKEAIRFSRANLSVEAMGNQYYSLITDALNGKYPSQRKRRGFMVTPNLNPEQLLDKYFDILFISGTDSVKKMYKFWMNQLITKQKPISEVLYKSGIRRVAIFGTLKNALYLTKDLSMAGIEVLCYLDNNPEMQGRELCQLPVNSSSWLAQNKEAVDAVVISIESKSDIIVKAQLQKTTINNMKVLTWKELVQLNGFN